MIITVSRTYWLRAITRIIDRFVFINRSLFDQLVKIKIGLVTASTAVQWIRLVEILYVQIFIGSTPGTAQWYRVFIAFINGPAKIGTWRCDDISVVPGCEPYVA